MATDPTQTTGPGAKKKKPVPTWYYIVGAGVLTVAYYMYSKNKQSQAAAAAATAATTPATATAPVAAGSYGNAGDLASLLPYLQMQGANSTAAAPIATNSGVTNVNSGLTGDDATNMFFRQNVWNQQNGYSYFTSAGLMPGVNGTAPAGSFGSNKPAAV